MNMNQYVTGAVIRILREKNRMTRLHPMIRRNAGNWRRRQICCLEEVHTVRKNSRDRYSDKR